MSSCVPNCPQIFQELLNNERFADITLVTVDEKQVLAHKIILGSNSTFFKSILRKYPHQNTLIYLKDIKHKYLEWIVKFLYTGHLRLCN